MVDCTPDPSAEPMENALPTRELIDSIVEQIKDLAASIPEPKQTLHNALVNILAALARLNLLEAGLKENAEKLRVECERRINRSEAKETLGSE